MPESDKVQLTASYSSSGLFRSPTIQMLKSEPRWTRGDSKILRVMWGWLREGDLSTMRRRLYGVGTLRSTEASEGDANDEREKREGWIGELAKEGLATVREREGEKVMC